MKKTNPQSVIVSWAIALVLFWFGINELISPSDWVAFVPSFISDSLASNLVLLHGILLIAGAVLLVIGYYRKYVAIVVSLMLLEITMNLIISNGQLVPDAVRDFGLFGAALSLVFSEPWKKGKNVLT